MKVQSMLAVFMVLGLSGCTSQADNQISDTQKRQKQQIDSSADLTKKAIDSNLSTENKDVDAAKKSFDASAYAEKKQLTAIGMPRRSRSMPSATRKK